MPKQSSRHYQGDDPVRLYLTDIGRFKLLTKEEEVRLAQQIEEGVLAARQLEQGSPRRNSNRYRELKQLVRQGERAKKDFINANLRLVVSIAKTRTGNGLDLLELIQEGNLGMMHAVDKFDWRKGFKFSTYATNWIKQSIDRAIANKARAVRLPVHQIADIKKLHKTQARLAEKFGREPSLTEVAEDLGWDISKVEDLVLLGREEEALDRELTEGSKTSLIEMLGVDPEKSLLDDADHVHRLIAAAGLSTQQKRVLSLRFVREMGYEEIGEELGFSREIARRQCNDAVQLLRSASRTAEEE